MVIRSRVMGPGGEPICLMSSYAPFTASVSTICSMYYIVAFQFVFCQNSSSFDLFLWVCFFCAGLYFGWISSTNCDVFYFYIYHFIRCIYIVDMETLIFLIHLFRQVILSRLNVFIYTGLDVSMYDHQRLPLMFYYLLEIVVSLVVFYSIYSK